MADPALALFYEFAKKKTLASRYGLGPTIDIIRGPIGTFFDSAGVNQNITANAGRFDHDPVTLKSLGLLIEEERENIALRSASFAAPWTSIGTPVLNATSAIAPDGTLTAGSINDDTGAAFEGIQQLMPIPVASSVYSYSTFLKKADINSLTFGINWRTSGGTIPTPNPKPRINAENGEVQDLNSGINSVKDVGEYWRVETQILTQALNTDLLVQLFAATSGNGRYRLSRSNSL